MLFIPDEIDAVMILGEAWESAEAMFFGASAEVVGLADIEGSVAAACDDVGIEHIVNL